MVGVQGVDLLHHEARAVDCLGHVTGDHLLNAGRTRPGRPQLLRRPDGHAEAFETIAEGGGYLIGHVSCSTFTGCCKRLSRNPA